MHPTSSWLRARTFLGQEVIEATVAATVGTLHSATLSDQKQITELVSPPLNLIEVCQVIQLT
jgi:hypothetical protein